MHTRYVLVCVGIGGCICFSGVNVNYGSYLYLFVLRRRSEQRQITLKLTVSPINRVVLMDKEGLFDIGIKLPLSKHELSDTSEVVIITCLTWYS